MALTTDGSLYKIRFSNANQSYSIYVTLTGDNFSPETIWTLAKGMVSGVKSVWFEPNDTVVVREIECTGGITLVTDPSL